MTNATDGDGNTTDPPKLKGMAWWYVGGIVLGLLMWIGWLYPLRASTLQGWIAELGSGLLVLAWAWACVRVLLWLQKQQRYVLLYRCLGLLIALSLGAGIFAVAYEARAFLSANFAYH